jgi:hypothetical protein
MIPVIRVPSPLVWRLGGEKKARAVLIWTGLQRLLG